MLLKDKVALVTAGASGMGRAAAEVRARRCPRHRRRRQRGQRQGDRRRHRRRGRQRASEIVDVRDLAALEALADKVQSEHGKLHVLYNNVGIPGAAGQNLTPEEWDTSIEINARAASSSAAT